jgi:hypothetical protein
MTQSTATTRRLEGYARRRGLTVGISRYSTGEYAIANRDGVPLSHPRRLGYTAAEAESAIDIEAQLAARHREGRVRISSRSDLRTRVSELLGIAATEEDIDGVADYVHYDFSNRPRYGQDDWKDYFDTIDLWQIAGQTP